MKNIHNATEWREDNRETQKAEWVDLTYHHIVQKTWYAIKVELEKKYMALQYKNVSKIKNWETTMKIYKNFFKIVPKK